MDIEIISGLMRVAIELLEVFIKAVVALGVAYLSTVIVQSTEVLSWSVAFDGWLSTILLGWALWYITERSPSRRAGRRSFEILYRELVNNLTWISKRKPEELASHFYRQIGVEVMTLLDEKAGDDLAYIYQIIETIKDRRNVEIGESTRSALLDAFKGFLNGSSLHLDVLKRRRIAEKVGDAFGSIDETI